MHQQLSIQAAQEAHTIPGVSNLGHPPEQNNSQTHLIAALYLLKPWQRRKLLHEPLQEEEARTLLRTPEVKVKTLSESETPSTSHSEGLLGPLEGLEDLMDPEILEHQENQQYPPIILFPSNQEEK